MFAPKFRRKEIYGKLKQEIGAILRELCRRKEVEIIEAEACPDHMHMLVSIPPKYSGTKNEHKRSKCVYYPSTYYNYHKFN